MTKKTSYIKEILFLTIFSVIFTELLSSNISIVQLTSDPLMPAFLLILGYGGPVLIIREIYIRWNLGYFGLLLLGLAYGFLNEAIYAKTILFNENLPIDKFNGYAGKFDINYAWAIVIITWHAFFAVIFPISISHFFFDKTKNTPWIGLKTTIILSTFIALAASLIFFASKPNNIDGTLLHYIIFTSCMFILTYFAYTSEKTKPSTEKEYYQKILWPFILGIIFSLLLIPVTTILAEMNSPTILIIFIVGIILKNLDTALTKPRQSYITYIATFAISSYFTFSIITMIIQFHKNNMMVVTTEIAIQIILIFMLYKIIKKNKSLPHIDNNLVKDYNSTEPTERDDNGKK